MKIIENVTLYKCDFCPKELKRKHAMSNHEERCYKNPENDRPCLHCQNLEQKEIEFYTGIDTYHGAGPIYRKSKTFYCKAKDILLLHPKTAYFTGHGQISWVNLNDVETEQFDMPLTCDIFDKENKDIAKLLSEL